MDDNVDNTTMDDYIDLIENKIRRIDSYCLELQGYMALVRELTISHEMSQEGLEGLEMLLLAATRTCDDLDDQMKEAVEAMQEMLPI